ncbi:HlyD family secretion protein [Botrimarina hoheduenensis]|uniref:HlyD family secretion protein n=2 Tax=Botrimarina hoheduenensis TaxID=2528000 RepID=A0A5C5VS20_9BACT|nr:HlyD family secretion protein [Botrimarina hoheduenensis]
MLLLMAGAAGGGWWAWQLLSPAPIDTKKHDALLHTVERDDFELLVTERGTIESAGSAEVRSQVQATDPAGVAILRIVPEGTEVQEGDFLVELDSSSLLSERTLQKVKVNTAQAVAVEARNKHETALIALEEYVNGKYVQERQTILSEVFVKEEDLSRAVDYLAYSKRLAGKGYVNELQLEADRFSVEKSRNELDAAKTKLRVLDEYTKAKEVKTLESEIIITKAKWDSEQSSYDLEAARLESIEDQIKKCLITSPKSGVVNYAHDNNGWNNDGFVVEEGAKVRERQMIIRLPDPTKMEVAVEINETLVQYVKQGMPASVSLVGSEGLVLSGTVRKVNQYAQPDNWRRANVKEYKALVAIDEASDAAKTGMTASVTISSIYEPKVLQAPVEAIYAHGDTNYCFVDRGDGLEAQRVECGPTNDRFIVVRSGLEQNDRVAINPRRLVDRVDLPELTPEQSQQAVNTGGGSNELRKRTASRKAEPAAAVKSTATETTTDADTTAPVGG